MRSDVGHTPNFIKIFIKSPFLGVLFQNFGPKVGVGVIQGRGALFSFSPTQIGGVRYTRGGALY